MAARRALIRSGRIPAAALAAHEATLIAAARDLFYEHGFEGTSIDAVARAAHVSPKTIYARFGSKEGLFGACMRSRADEILASLRVPLSSGDDVRALLADFARRLLTVTSSVEALNIQRLVIGESARFPELGQEFMEAGPRRGIATLASFFVRATASGFMRVPDAAVAAEMFTGALLGVPVRAALITHTRPSRTTIARRADDVVALFLAAYGAAAAHASAGGRDETVP